MKKALSFLLAMILTFSVMMPITVSAEVGSSPNIFTDDLAALEIGEPAILWVDTVSGKSGAIYPAAGAALSGATYSADNNILTLKSVVKPDTVLVAYNMGNNFCINVNGYNELLSIRTFAEVSECSLTIDGTGDIIINRRKNDTIGGIIVYGNGMASTLTIGADVGVKASKSTNGKASVVVTETSVKENTITVSGATNSAAIVTEQFEHPIYAQADVYNFDTQATYYYDMGFQKSSTDFRYIGYKYYDDNGNDTGLYNIYSLEYDDSIGMYVATPYNDGNPVNPSEEGFTQHSKLPRFDSENEAYIGNPTNREPDPDIGFRQIFIPQYKTKMNLCANAKCGFIKHVNENGSDRTYQYAVYQIIDHPTYGLLARYQPNYKIENYKPDVVGSEDRTDAYYTDELVVNNAGPKSVPASVKLVSAKNYKKGIKITWKKDVNATGYRVYRKTGTGKWTALTTISKYDTTTYTDNSVKSGTTYTYTVKAYNDLGWGSYDTKGLKIRHLKEPTVSLSNVTSGVKVSWDKITSATGYNVYRRIKGKTEWTRIATKIKTTSFTDKKAENAKKYEYTVVALRNSEKSTNTPKAIHYLRTPKIKSVTNTESGTKVVWNTNKYGDGYIVYRKTGSGSWQNLITIKNPNVTTLYDDTCVSGKKYTYTVRAYDGSVRSSFYSGGTTMYLAQPDIQLVYYIKGVNVSYTKVSGAKKYYIYRKSGSGSWKKIATTSASASNVYVDKNTKKGVQYKYSVRAVNGSYMSKMDTTGYSYKR